MKYFRDLRLGTKLGGSYALLVLLIALCAVISWLGLAKVDQHADSLPQELWPKVELSQSVIGLINTAMNQLNRITQQNASAAEELAATAEEMSGQAEQLQQLMGFFTLTGHNASERGSVSAVCAKANEAQPAPANGKTARVLASAVPAGFVRFQE